MQITALYEQEENTIDAQILRVGADGAVQRQPRTLLREGLLKVYINERLSMEIVCTMTELPALVVGRLYTEGWVETPDAIRSLCIDGDGAKVSTDRPMLSKKIDAFPILPDFRWETQWIFDLVRAFSEGAELFEKTHGIHSCYLMYEGEVKYICEDIGRHNALDKAVGRALIDGVDLTRCVLFSSGRIPDDMMEKAIYARVPVLVSNSVTTDRAVDLARQYHVTLICKARPDGFDMYSCPELWNKQKAPHSTKQ